MRYFSNSFTWIYISWNWPYVTYETFQSTYYVTFSIQRPILKALLDKITYMQCYSLLTSIQERTEWLQRKSIKQFHNHQQDFKRQGSATLLTMTDAYLAMDDSGDCWSFPITGNKGDERMNCLQSGWAHILAREKRAIFKGDSFVESFLVGFSADTA